MVDSLTIFVGWRGEGLRCKFASRSGDMAKSLEHYKKINICQKCRIFVLMKIEAIYIVLQFEGLFLSTVWDFARGRV